MSKDITLDECKQLHDKFLKFADRAEQHSFLQLFHIDLMMEHSIKKWEDEGVNQEEARSMFRVVNTFMGEEE